ncbi:DUF1996 domain-containing protein [Dactylosporangium sp. NPDC048998]|uniref:DUF1996 domain-containing protein n=1 Tax=Dactylosporangium sp. NPDC048998 TaxID=3363976 RepID=UPI00371DE7DE
MIEATGRHEAEGRDPDDELLCALYREHADALLRFVARLTNRTTTKYPVCPQGSQIQRILDFPSCWDGKNTDSANHRSHIVFPNADGKCPRRTSAVPRLRMTISYDRQAAGTFALDSFPEQLHSPITDHGDFANVMAPQLMNFVVGCINSGRRC